MFFLSVSPLILKTPIAATAQIRSLNSSGTVLFIFSLPILIFKLCNLFVSKGKLFRERFLFYSNNFSQIKVKDFKFLPVQLENAGSAGFCIIESNSHIFESMGRFHQPEKLGRVGFWFCDLLWWGD